MKSNPHTRRAGFTLAEMMVVIVIIGILATIVVPNVWRNFWKGQEAKLRADITAITSSLTEYAMNNAGQYPASLEALVTPDENGHRYLNASRTPRDPWGADYAFDPPGAGATEPRVYSLGKDHAPGGEGENADVDNFAIRDGTK